MPVYGQGVSGAFEMNDEVVEKAPVSKADGVFLMLLAGNDLDAVEFGFGMLDCNITERSMEIKSLNRFTHSCTPSGCQFS